MKRFRFSLLSLLVGVVLAGGVVILNHQVSPWDIEVHDPLGPNQGNPYLSFRSYGWPFYLVSERALVSLPTAGKIKVVSTIDYLLHWPGLAANIVIGLLIVLCGAGVCEWLVRRRSAKAKE